MNKVRAMSALLRALPITTALLTLGWGARPGQAQLGGQLFATGGDVRVTVQPPAPGVEYTSDLFLDSAGGPNGLGVSSRDVGTIDLGIFPAGVELIFGIHVRNTGYDYVMGPGSRNPDGIAHAIVEPFGPGQSLVRFEDLFGGGDFSYTDVIFVFDGGLTPGFGVKALYDQTKAHKLGSTVPIKIQVCDTSGANVSSSSLSVSAVSLTKSDASADGSVEDSGNANPDSNFRYDASLAGYIFNLSTKPLSTGTWVLSFTVGADPTVQHVQFDVK